MREGQLVQSVTYNSLPRQCRPEGWRPQRDLTGGYEVTPDLTDDVPTSPADALEYVRFLGIQGIADYDGQACQASMIADEAKARFPHLFLAESAEPDRPESAITITAEEVVAAYFSRHRRPDGAVDWQSVAADTLYAASRTHYTAASTVPAEWSTGQLDGAAVTA